MNLPTPDITVDWGQTDRPPATDYYERKIGKTLYRVKCVYMGKIDFAKAMEEMIVRKVLRELQEGGLLQSTK